MQHRRPANKGLVSRRSPQERDRLHRGVVLIPGFMDTPGLFRRMGRALACGNRAGATVADIPRRRKCFHFG